MQMFSEMAGPVKYSFLSSDEPHSGPLPLLDLMQRTALQFDTSATAVIMTRHQTRAKYENLLGGSQEVESKCVASAIKPRYQSSFGAHIHA